MVRTAHRLLLVSLSGGLLTALSCTLLTPLDGLSGGAAPGDDASAREGGGEAGGGGDGGKTDDSGSPGSAYASAVLADKPLAYFRLNETTGSVARSMVGSATGKYEGMFAFGAAGAVGDGDPSVTFDGTTTRIDLGDVFRFGGTASFTLECWMKPSVAGDTRFVFDRRTTASPTDGYTVYFGTTYFAFSRSAKGTELGYVGKQASPPLDAWTHSVVTFDGNANRMYIDGALVQENNAASPIGGGVGSFTIGDDSPGQFNKFMGQIDEVAIYDSALAAPRVLAHFQAAR